MRLSRNRLYLLEIETNTYLLYEWHGLEKTVVIAFPSAKSMTFGIEGHTRYQGYDDLVIVSKGRSDGFHDMESPLTKIG